jgi:nitrogen fixation/metabolism regulation signal transduction histidine kinase
MTAHESEVLERATRTIVQQVETMKQMVDAFRDYARAPQIDLTSFELNRLINEVVDLYKGGDPRIQMETDLESDLGLIEADSGRVRQILHNLLRNAAEALHDAKDGLISVKTRKNVLKNQPVAEISIIDNGPGFQKTMVRSVFEPYVTTKPKGTGLGLAIVKKLVEEHAGTIQLENREQGGACVRIMLPLNEKARLTLISRSNTEEVTRESA